MVQVQLKRRHLSLAHYGMQASHNTPGRGHENGDIEQGHHRFKRGVGQELILRGSRDFAHREEYDAFLRRLLLRRNAARRTRFAEEVAVMHALPTRRLEDQTRQSVRVSRNSTVLVRGNFYSVPSQLIGERVEVRIHVEHLEVWYGGREVQQMPRLRGMGKHRINYRHIIETLVRKPGAFAQYRYREDLFPRVVRTRGLLFSPAMLLPQYQTMPAENLYSLSLSSSAGEVFDASKAGKLATVTIHAKQMSTAPNIRFQEKSLSSTH